MLYTETSVGEILLLSKGSSKQEQIQFQHFQHLRCLVVRMKGWANPNEADGHMRYPKNMFHSNW